MKKHILRLTGLMLLTACLVLTVSAASAHMSLSGSPASAARGETVSVTVNLSNDQPVAYGGIVLSFDSTVFEITGGSCHVSGATLAEVSASRGGGTFILQNDEVVSGRIFTINLRVKSDAPFGRYNISGSGSINGAGCGVSGTTVSVVCTHSYGDAVRIDEANHRRTCTICGESKSEGHTWDPGAVTQAATCKTAGTRLHTCTACGAEKTETIPVSETHTFGPWSKTDERSHTHQCSVCGKEESQAHSWKDGKVTKAATCKETGSMEQTCADCAARKTVELPKTDHRFGPWTGSGDQRHSHKCSDCGKEETRDHRFGDAWSHDADGHFRRCADCGHTTDRAAHIPGPEPTETTDQLCTECGRMLRPNTAHNHSFGDDWLTDALGHWHQCTLCDERQGFALHVYADDCDTDCDLCAAQRSAPHTPGADWMSDESGHWRLCGGCGGQAQFQPHTPGPEATTASAQTCTDCGFVIVPVLPHDHVYAAGGTAHTHTCACGEAYTADAKTCQVCRAENRPFPWWILCIAEALAFGGYVYMQYRKKHT